MQESDAFLETQGLQQALELAAAIGEREDRIRRIGAEESRQRSLIESLRPWESLDLPLETEGTERSALVLGSFSNRIPLSEVESALAEAAEERGKEALRVVKRPAVGLIDQAEWDRVKALHRQLREEVSRWR